MKQLNTNSVVLENVHRWDHPDYCDAFIGYAEWEDGTPLTDDELEEANEDYGDLINELANETAWQE